jgi:adenylate cyclase
MGIDMGNVVEELERQRRYYETLIEVSPTAIVTGDAGLIITSWNPAAERLFGYTKREAVGRHIDDLVANGTEIRHGADAVNRELAAGPIQLITRQTLNAPR